MEAGGVHNEKEVSQREGKKRQRLGIPKEFPKEYKKPFPEGLGE